MLLKVGACHRSDCELSNGTDPMKNDIFLNLFQIWNLTLKASVFESTLCFFFVTFGILTNVWSKLKEDNTRGNNSSHKFPAAMITETQVPAFFWMTSGWLTIGRSNKSPYQNETVDILHPLVEHFSRVSKHLVCLQQTPLRIKAPQLMYPPQMLFLRKKLSVLYSSVTKQELCNHGAVIRCWNYTRGKYLFCWDLSRIVLKGLGGGQRQHTKKSH